MTADDGEFRDRLDRVGELVEALEVSPDAASREAARELVRTLLDLHAVGLARLMELAGGADVNRFAADRLVSSLLLLHDLHPHTAETRVKAALEGTPLSSRAGDVELISATDELVRIRLRGDAAAGPELRAAVEDLVIAAVPDVAAIEFEEAWDTPAHGRMPLPLLRR